MGGANAMDKFVGGVMAGVGALMFGLGVGAAVEKARIDGVTLQERGGPLDPALQAEVDRLGQYSDDMFLNATVWSSLGAIAARRRQP